MAGLPFAIPAASRPRSTNIATNPGMRTMRLLPALALSLALAAACSEDAPGSDPGGQGAGRPDTTGASQEATAQEVLGNTGLPENQDTTAAGVPGMTGTLRDSLHDGEAIPGANQPQPDRPGY